MRSASAHGDHFKRRRVTVAELLGRDRPGTFALPRQHAPHGSAVETALIPVTPQPPGWSGPGSARWPGLVVSAGAVLATGAILAAGALCRQPEHGPMSAQAADGGHPASQPSAEPRSARPSAAPGSGPSGVRARPTKAQTPARGGPANPVSLRSDSRPELASARAPHSREPVRTRARDGRDAPATAGSAFSSLTPAIDQADALIDPLS